MNHELLGFFNAGTESWFKVGGRANVRGGQSVIRALRKETGVGNRVITVN